MGALSSLMAKMIWSSIGFYERVVHIDFISFFIVNARIHQDKYDLVGHINFLTLEVKDFIQPILHLGFCLGSHLKKTGTQGTNLCSTVSSSSWNVLNRWVVKLVFFFVKVLVQTFSDTWYEHIFHTTALIPPEEAELFPVLCRIILIWFVFLRDFFVIKHKLFLIILQYLCL